MTLLNGGDTWEVNAGLLGYREWLTFAVGSFCIEMCSSVLLPDPVRFPVSPKDSAAGFDEGGNTAGSLGYSESSGPPGVCKQM